MTTEILMTSVRDFWDESDSVLYVGGSAPAGYSKEWEINDLICDLKKQRTNYELYF